MTETLLSSSIERPETAFTTDSRLLEGILRKDNEMYTYRSLLAAEIQVLYDRAHDRQPKLAEWLVASNTDGLHGTQSGSMRSILQRGILPHSDHHLLPHPVTSIEFKSLPEPRPYVHMVHWLFAQETVPYSEKPNEPVTPANYGDAILPDESLKLIEHSPLMAATHLRNRHLTAVALRDYLQSPDADPDHVAMLVANFPVVFGIQSNELEQDNLQPVTSIIHGDISYEGSIGPALLTCLFVPAERVAEVATQTNKPVFALEALRDMTDNLL